MKLRNICCCYCGFFLVAGFRNARVHLKSERRLSFAGLRAIRMYDCKEEEKKRTNTLL